MVCLGQCENASNYLLDGVLGEIHKSQCCAEKLPMAGEERILEMVCRDISCYLLIQILETQDELGDGFMGSLFDSVELAKQFAYGDLTVEKFQKLRADILEGGKLPRVASRIPSCGGAIEVKCKFGDFGRIDLCSSKPLRRVVGLPCV